MVGGDRPVHGDREVPRLHDRRDPRVGSCGTRLAPSGWRFDPYTFTFLTLILSLQASYAAPLILLAQNRQADRDRLADGGGPPARAAQKADTEYLAREIASLRIALGEVATRDFLRSELARMAEELDEAASAGPSWNGRRRRRRRWTSRPRRTNSTRTTTLHAAGPARPAEPSGLSSGY